MTPLVAGPGRKPPSSRSPLVPSGVAVKGTALARSMYAERYSSDPGGCFGSGSAPPASVGG